ncbi:MAG: AAA family ATPase [Bacillota bacterium]|nr:AAA family ATPase [Bacillota bacterium]
MILKFPHNEEREIKFGKPIVLLGANGSGKTRFSIRIEELNDPSFSQVNVKEVKYIHRISAQKLLSINDTISVFDNDSSQKNLFVGDPHQYATKMGYRFGSNPATHLIADYDKALSLLFSMANKELEDEHKKNRIATEKEAETPVYKPTVVERATDIWNELLPHRKIDLSGNGVHALYGAERYHGKEMSDGERVMLYMICQALVQRPKTLLIIDEPELHIHKAIVNKLWSVLEAERRDCAFMYITHDLSFAASRVDPDIIWIKNYNGRDWQYEMINSADFEELPEELLFEIMGSRTKIAFVEGEKSSLDYQLYQEIYREKGYHIIPCGGCQDVIRLVKAKRNYERLASIEVVGIIDRDFRPDAEIEALKRDGIYCLDVAEVENLFVVPEVLDIMEQQLGCDAGKADEAKAFIKDLYDAQKDKQIAEAISKEISFQLSLFEMDKSRRTAAEIKDLIDGKYTIENINKWCEEKCKVFEEASSTDEILRVFNYKNLSKSIGCKFGLSDKAFPQRVLNLIGNQKLDARSKLLDAIRKYVPELP